MVAGKVKTAMGFQKSPARAKPPPPPQQQSGQKGSGVGFSRSFGVYFPRSSAQVQPRSPDLADLLRLVEELRERESRLKTELLEHKLLKESIAILPVLEHEISSKDSEIERSREKIDCLEAENDRLRCENEFLHSELTRQNYKYEERIKYMQDELWDIKRAVSEQDVSSSSSSSTTPVLINVINNYQKPNWRSTRCLRKCATQINSSVGSFCENAVGKNEAEIKREEFSGVRESMERPRHSRCKSDEIPNASGGLLVGTRSRAPRVPKPPPKTSTLALSALSPTHSLLSCPADVEISNIPLPPPLPQPLAKLALRPPPPPPLPPSVQSKAAAAPQLAEISNLPPPPLPQPSTKLAPQPPPPPPPPPREVKSRLVEAKVRRVPEVVEFYHSLMRRDSIFRRDSSSGGGPTDGAAGPVAKDMIGEIENRSAHLLAIKTDVETQGDFIKFLIKEVEGAAFTDIEDVLPFVKWLDDELSYLVDERAVLKHFDWPEQKADALREAAFGYSDFKKLESEASSFQDDPRQPCAPALKKMHSLFEKLEHGLYNLSRMRESATKRYKLYQIPMNWMMDTGFVNQIKLASVKLAMKYMKRVSTQLGVNGGSQEEEALMLQGVKFAFRVHQFAGGFDVETMGAFQELRDKARLCCNVQSEHQQRFICGGSSSYSSYDNKCY